MTQQPTFRQMSELNAAVVAKLKRCQEIYGLTNREMSKRLGVPMRTYQDIVQRGVVPHVNSELWARMVGVWQGKTYENAPRLVTRLRKDRKKLKHVTAWLTRGEWDELGRMADRAGMNREEMTTLAVQHALEDWMPLVTIKAIKKELMRLEVKMRIINDPNMARFICADDEVAKLQARADPVDAVPRPQHVPPHELILGDMIEEDGPAVEVYLGEDDWEDRFDKL